MSLESLEKKIESLEKEIKKIPSLEHEITRLQAINEIQNLMGRYEVCHNHTEGPKMWELFSQRPDTWIEISDQGVCVGIENIKMKSQPAGKDSAGIMFEHDLTTPIIIVAKDGQTAKGTWWAPGHETRGYDGKPRVSLWAYGKYGVDFVKDNGEWKIWHFKWFRTFITPFNVDWQDRKRELEHKGTVDKPWISKPARYHKPYFPDLVQVSIPPAPKPYDTWTEKEEEWQFRPSEHP